MSDAAPSSYETVPYDSYPFADTHPDRLATMARLFGMTPPPVERARVLEFGCAGGGNLIPMAQAMPEAQFLGVDLSSRQVADGRAMIEALGLKNIDLRAMSILDADESLGTFDYIICHGVYSWVPPEVQQQILALCTRQLAPDGVAYVSYNIYPGWHLRSMVREMMSYHVASIADPQARIDQARAILDFLVQSVWNPGSVYARFLEEQAERLKPKADSYVFHEYLEDVNVPLYYHEFVERAAEHGLKVLGDARFGSMGVNVSAALKSKLEALSADPVRQEQYLEFLRNRTFRRSLLCHEHVKLAAAPRHEAIAELKVVGLIAPVSALPTNTSTVLEVFRTPQGATVASDDPVIKTALTVLHEQLPQPIAFEALWAEVQSRLARSPGAGSPQIDHNPGRLQESLLQGYAAGWATLHVFVPHFVREAGERPVASPVARLQAEKGSRVTDLWHLVSELSRFESHVIRLLDGQHDRAALREILAGFVADGKLELRHAGPPPHDPARVREIVSQALEAALKRLAASALLIR
ncbi:MAG TPA: class I SAM-dependent methyltransferase [Isosphaeraceae bacterium]|nr:class I SAM-dependent methyltransferase [Isosphaeraceae bacterium]